MHRGETGDSGEVKGITGSAEPFSKQPVGDMVESAREHAEPRECRQGEGKTYLYVFHYRRVFLGSEVVDYAIPRKVNLTAWAVLSHRALDSKL